MILRRDAVFLYLDLIKKALCFSLYEETGVPLETFNHVRSSALRRIGVRVVADALARAGLQIVKKPKYDKQKWTDGSSWPMQAHTMIGMKRMDNVQECVENVIRDCIPGDLIETGVWRGGACIFMRAILAAHGVTDRLVYVADSFQGLPKPEEGRYEQDQGAQFHKYDFLAVSEEQVAANFEKYGLLDEQVVFLKGWFKDTLPKLEAKSLAVIRLDGDMYASTMDAIMALYPKLSIGGYCIIDDYPLPPCRRAVDDFRAGSGITEPIREIDWSGVYWRKERESSLKFTPSTSSPHR